jgi:hypothetical protein
MLLCDQHKSRCIQLVISSSFNSQLRVLSVSVLSVTTADPWFSLSSGIVSSRRRQRVDVVVVPLVSVWVLVRSSDLDQEEVLEGTYENPERT